MKRKTKKHKHHGSLIKTSEPNELIYWAGLGFILLFLFIAPFHTGLFNGYPFQYERYIYSAVA